MNEYLLKLALVVYMCYTLVMLYFGKWIIKTNKGKEQRGIE